ncbi:MAG: methionyl-tRNA formyltransferase [Bacteroidetes bacterium]|nr:methionyl-tRNA formyltransferase [Bacteroidota bacterium]
MGTPQFAVPSLEILFKNSYNVVAVITAPDRSAGRGLKLRYSSIKESAIRHNTPVLQPKNLKAPAFLEELKSYQADLQVVVAFRMLPESVWNMPSLGTFNLHASLLPQYRGAAPINWAIINGEKETGVTTFFIKHEIDTGDIIYQEKEPIYDDDDAGTLHDRLMEKGAELVLKTVQAIDRGNCPQILQQSINNKEIKHAPKIIKETCRINWELPSQKIVDFVRGLTPYPAAWTILNGKLFKIFTTKAIKEIEGIEGIEGIEEIKAKKSVEAKPGTYLTDNKKFLHYVTGDGLLAVEEVQMEGKKRMNIEEFLRGNKVHST